MSQLGRIRRKQQTFGRRALGLFVAVWLNLALQPCAMAYDVDADADCPNCPPAEMQHHDAMHGDTEHDMPCADAASDCMLDADLNHDGRGGQIKLKDAPTVAPIAITTNELLLPFNHPGNATLHPRYASEHAGAPPSLHVLHCVYLK